MVMKVIVWHMMKFPPINLYNAPIQYIKYKQIKK